MSDQPKIQIESERKTTHWFSRPFYRRDGRKNVLETRKLKRLGLIAFAVGYASFLSQGEPATQASESSSFKLSAMLGTPSKEIQVPPAGRGSKQASSKESKPRPGTRKEGAYSAPQLVNRPRVPLPAGIAVRARLLTGASNGPVRAELIEPIIVEGALLQEAGPTLVGIGSSSEERLQVHFTRMIFSDGEGQAINAEALDPDDRTAGLRGSLLGNRAGKIAASIGLSFTAGMAEGLQETDARNGTAFRKSTLKNSLLNGVSTAALEQSHEMLSDLRNSHPVIHVAVGKEFLVIFNGE